MSLALMGCLAVHSSNAEQRSVPGWDVLCGLSGGSLSQQGSAQQAVLHMRALRGSAPHTGVWGRYTPRWLQIDAPLPCRADGGHHLTVLPAAPHWLTRRRVRPAQPRNRVAGRFTYTGRVAGTVAVHCKGQGLYIDHWRSASARLQVGEPIAAWRLRLFHCPAPA